MNHPGSVCLGLVSTLVLSFGLIESISAQPFGGTATTESVCNVGMGKDEQGRTCEVPIPPGCNVANFPGSDKPWTNVSKGGNIACRFDEKSTDWNSRIIGTCSKCKTNHCSARFSVMFNCSGSGAPDQYKPQGPGQ